MATIFLIAGPRIASAWGRDGHFIVAQIASDYLTPVAREAVAKLIPDQSLAEISVWADEIRGQPQYAFSLPLHYVNVPKNAEGFVMERDCPEGKCVVGAIRKYAAALRSKDISTKERQEAFKFLVHFIGDIHQPLHVSYEEDRGGNDIKVRFFGEQTNLHAVWDTGLIRHREEPWEDYSEELRSKITDAEKAEWEIITDPAAWANQSYRLAVINAYPIPASGELGEEYSAKNILVVEQRLSMAAVRLAAMLNSIFGEDGTAIP